MSAVVKPAQITLNALRDGQTMNELAQAIHDASVAVRDHNKPATVTLELKFEPLKGVAQGLKESPMVCRAKVVTKLPEPETPTTLFYSDEHGNPTRQPPEREPQLGLTVAGTGTQGS